MEKLTRSDLWSLEEYAERRPEFRSRVMAHKRNRKVHLGSHSTLYFEDRMTIHYQIQEMLRAERIFEREGIDEELAAYNPLIPDGANLKATFMVEYEDPQERQFALARLLGIEDRLWVQVQGNDRVWAIADEDLERDEPGKTSSVHFVRFEFTPAMIAGLRGGADLSVGVDHPEYSYAVSPLPREIRNTLAADLD